ncbi:MAG TPA: hypothetical protein VJY34_04745 [Roseiarcus sp.]|nr:hypothetical protein [Roseiarcus sp.]
MKTLPIIIIAAAAFLPAEARAQDHDPSCYRGYYDGQHENYQPPCCSSSWSEESEYRSGYQQGLNAANEANDARLRAEYGQGQ